MHSFGYLYDIFILLLASFAVVIVFKQLKLSPALGYLVAGAAIGPFGFGILTSTETTKSIAELGIVFLLFAIGLELTFEKLIAIKTYVLGFGSLQIIATATAITTICHKFFAINLESSIIIGGALALSSTAIVMQVIAENGEENTRVGRLSFAVLLMQDLVVIPILVLLPLLANKKLAIMPALGEVTVNAIMAMTLIFISGRLFLRPIYRIIADLKSDVLFLSFTLIVIFGASLISNRMGLSFALGAFIAGLMVAETEYRYRVEEEIISLKHLLMGLFFMSIGMSFDFDLLLKSLPYILLLSLILITVKASIIIGLCKLFKFPLAPSIHAGLLLAQGGEFAFVVFVMAVQKKLIEQDVAQFLITIVTLTMALTPIIANIGRRIKTALYTKDVLKDNKIKREIDEMSNHIIVVGFTKVGRIISYILKKSTKNYIIIDNNHRLVRIEKTNGYNISYGDAMNLDILKYIGIERAEAIIIAMEDEITCMKITRFISQNFPEVNVVTKSENIKNADRFKKIGANLVISKNVETALQLSKVALKSIGINNNEIESILTNFRDMDPESFKEIVNENRN